MKKTLSLIASTCLLLAGVTLPSRANIVVNSDFDTGYTAGDLTGQSGTDDSGFSGAFGATNNTAETQTVIAGGLTYAAGDVDISGGDQSVQISSTTGGVVNALNRSFSGTLGGQTYYERVVIDPIDPSTNSGTDFAVELGGNQYSLSGAYEGLANANALAQGPDNSDTANGFSLSTGAANLLIAEFVYDSGTGEYDTVNFFLNPTSTTQGTPTASVSTTGADLGTGLTLCAANFSNADGDVVYDIDSFAVGTSYADVVTAPEPGAPALMLVGGLGLAFLAVRRRRFSI